MPESDAELAETVFPVCPIGLDVAELAVLASGIEPVKPDEGVAGPPADGLMMVEIADIDTLICGLEMLGNEVNPNMEADVVSGATPFD